jgi:hypothetical protein
VVAEPDAVPEPFSNYFNYFTEIEEHFQRARGTGLFLLSPLDWALIETWKNSGVPLEAVLRGVDLAFEKWRAKRSRIQMVNSIAYCTQAVMTEAQRMADGGGQRPQKPQSAPFHEGELRSYMEANAAAIRATGVVDFAGVAEALDRIEITADLEAIEQHLTILEHKLIALARSRQTEAEALAARRDLESHLRAWRSKMTAPQIAMLEAQYLDRSTLEAARLPRLSLFYLR